MIKPSALIVVVLMGVIACEDTSKRVEPTTVPGVKAEIPVTAKATISEPVSAPAPMAKIVKSENRVEAVTKKWLDTNIPPEMIKDIHLYVAAEKAEGEFSVDPVSLRPPNKTQLVVTPKFFLKEDDQVKESYIDYLDGAAVQVEVKFD